MSVSTTARSAPAQRAAALLDESFPSGTGSVLSIDAAAIVRNARRVREHVGERFFWGVVKARGYGLGDACTAKALLDGGADGLAVARLEEVVPLRQAGIDAPVLILGPAPRIPPPDPAVQVTAASAADLATIHAWGTEHPIHLKIDTGMGRLGLSPDANAWLAAVRPLADRIRGLWTHYSHADLVDHPTIGEQRDALKRCLQALAGEGIRPSQVHLANSAGLASLAPWETAVRVGLYAYGVPPWDADGRPLASAGGLTAPEPVVEWATRLLEIRETDAPGLSYRWLYRTAGPTRIGVIPVGYADGLPALHAGGLEIWTTAGRRPIRGRVTMDLAVVELQPDDRLREGEPVFLLGPRDAGDGIGVRELARAAGRVPYEVLTALGSRVVRCASP